MEQFKQKLKTIINKVKIVFLQSIKDSKLMDALFISIVFVMFGLSIMGICIALSSNKYKSAALNSNIQDSDIKELAGVGSFLKRDEDNQTDESNILNPQTPSEENNNQSTGNGAEGIGPGEETVPDKIISITCTSSFKSDIKKDGVTYPTNMIEQIIAKFDANTKRFYQADVSLALYYGNGIAQDLESLQKFYEEKLNLYASYFEISDPEVIFSAPTQAYINLKDLDYNTYKTGYRKETETYDSFLYTFKTGGYVCTT